MKFQRNVWRFEARNAYYILLFIVVVWCVQMFNLTGEWNFTIIKMKHEVIDIKFYPKLIIKLKIFQIFKHLNLQFVKLF